MPLAIRLKAVNAVIPKKRFYEKSNFRTSRGIKKSRSFKILFDKRLRSFQSNISSKVRENQRGFEAGPEVVALLVWVNLSWTGKTAQKLIIWKFRFLVRVFYEYSTIFIWRPHSSFLYFFKQRTRSQWLFTCWNTVSLFSSALFCNARSKVHFIFCPTLQNFFWMKLDSRRILFVVFFLHWWGFEIAPARANPASVNDHVMTSRDYTKVGQVKIWRLISSRAKQLFRHFHSECFFNFFFCFFILVSRSLFNCHFKASVILWDNFWYQA